MARHAAAHGGIHPPLRCTNVSRTWNTRSHLSFNNLSVRADTRPIDLHRLQLGEGIENPRGQCHQAYRLHVSVREKINGAFPGRATDEEEALYPRLKGSTL